MKKLLSIAVLAVFLLATAFQNNSGSKKFRIKSVTYGGFTRTLSYDKSGLLSQIYLEAGGTSYNYVWNEKEVSLNVEGMPLSFSRNSAGFILPDGISAWTWDYDANYNIRTVVNTASGTDAASTFVWKDGNITSMIKRDNGMIVSTTVYEYSSLVDTRHDGLNYAPVLREDFGAGIGMFGTKNLPTRIIISSPTTAVKEVVDITYEQDNQGRILRAKGVAKSGATVTKNYDVVYTYYN